jgi:hypothetical protein
LKPGLFCVKLREKGHFCLFYDRDWGHDAQERGLVGAEPKIPVAASFGDKFPIPASIVHV